MHEFGIIAESLKNPNFEHEYHKTVMSCLDTGEPE